MGKQKYVYAIQHNPTGRIYVGSTSNINNRIACHIRWLRSGKHNNKLMQSDYDRFGEDYSVFILDRYNKFEQRFIEYEWMDKLRTGDDRYGYNSRDSHYRNRKKTRNVFDHVVFEDGQPIPRWREKKMFDWIEELMEATGCDWDTAAREYDATHNPDYDPEDYDGAW